MAGLRTARRLRAPELDLQRALAPSRPFPRRRRRIRSRSSSGPIPNVYDGRWSNVGWLQELPKPVTNLSWDNAAIVSGATLTKLGLEEDDIVELTVAMAAR